jgi:hypothetical protein
MQAAYICNDSQPSALVRDMVLAPTVTLFGDTLDLARMARDCEASGLVTRGARPLASLLDGHGVVLGDVIYVETLHPSGADFAALVRLDDRATRAGAEVVVATTTAGLEGVFGSFERARTQFLVDPTPAERLVALGIALARVPGRRVRELDEADRLAMLRLTQEVARLAARLDRLALPLGSDHPDSQLGRLASPGIGYRVGEDRDLLRKPRVPLPDPRLVYQIIRQRRLRDRYFESELFADPAWDILLDLTAARAEHRRVSVTSLCIAAAVPATTGLRWIAQMTEAGILLRELDPDDKRRAFITLSDPVADAMARYFDELGKDAAKLI